VLETRKDKETNNTLRPSKRHVVEVPTQAYAKKQKKTKREMPIHTSASRTSFIEVDTGAIFFLISYGEKVDDAGNTSLHIAD
jgi:hypothetical protein